MIVWLNGNLIPAAEARVSVFDRGFVFGDGVYEGLRAIPAESRGSDDGSSGARIIGLDLHAGRLRDGLAAADIPFDAGQIREIADAVLAANAMRDAFVYVQVTRGEPRPGDAVRSRVPTGGSRSLSPTVFAYCSPQPPLETLDRSGPPTKTARVLPDIRWAMGRLKSISLMGNVLSSLAAAAMPAPADEAVFVREVGGRRLVTEGLATNIALALPDGSVVTPSLESAPMLAGVTRTILLRAEPSITERAVDAAELDRATEIMMLGTTTMVTSITCLDDRPINEGKPGPVARRLLTTLLRAIRAGA